MVLPIMRTWLLTALSALTVLQTAPTGDGALIDRMEEVLDVVSPQVPGPSHCAPDRALPSAEARDALGSARCLNAVKGDSGLRLRKVAGAGTRVELPTPIQTASTIVRVRPM